MIAALVAAQLGLNVAQDAPRRVLVEGFGNRSCGQWVQAHQDKASVVGPVMDAWMTGYLTAMATEADVDLLGGTDQVAQSAWITKYCTENPLDDIATASNKLTQALYDRVLKGSGS